MRKILTILSAFFGLYVSPIVCAGSKINPIIKCLGEEELQLHKAHTTGPVYQLNKVFIDEFTAINDVDVHEEFTKKICNDKFFSPSVNLLYHLIIENKRFFDTDKIQKGSSNDVFQMAAVDALQERVPFIFIQYLSDLQAMTATPSCLTDSIPELQYFFDRIKYLEEDSIRDLINDKAKIRAVFQKLHTFDGIIAKCKTDNEERKKKEEIEQKRKMKALMDKLEKEANPRYYQYKKSKEQDVKRIGKQEASPINASKIPKQDARPKSKKESKPPQEGPAKNIAPANPEENPGWDVAPEVRPEESESPPPSP